MNLATIFVLGAALLTGVGMKGGSVPPTTAVLVQQADPAALAEGSTDAVVSVRQRPTPTSGSRSGSASVPVDDPAFALASPGIPSTALQAYLEAAAREARLRPSCGIPWSLIAAIGRVESDHNRFDGGVLLPDGLATRPVIGIALDGHGTALIRDTDGGALDGDTVYDHAVGPMQFIPSTWARFGVDGNGDGVADPFNIFDAAATAADYLCIAGGDLRTEAGQARAVLAYNHSDVYVADVLDLERAYANGVGVIEPGGVGVPGAGGGLLEALPVATVGYQPPPNLPPVNPGPPPALTSGPGHSSLPPSPSSTSRSSTLSPSAPATTGCPTQPGASVSIPLAPATPAAPSPVCGATTTDTPTTDTPTTDTPTTDAPTTDAPTAPDSSDPAPTVPGS